MQTTVISAHESAYPDPVTFERGEALELGKRDDEYPGWIWVTTRSGLSGWAPETYVDCERGACHGTANNNYTAKELDTRVGEKLRVELQLLGWLWVVNASGEKGWIPKHTTSDS